MKRDDFRLERMYRVGKKTSWTFQRSKLDSSLVLPNLHSIPMDGIGFFFDNEGDTSLTNLPESDIQDVNHSELDQAEEEEDGVEDSKSEKSNKAKGKQKQKEASNDNGDKNQQSQPQALLLPEHVRVSQARKAREKQAGGDSGLEEEEGQSGEEDESRQERVLDGTGDYLEMDARSRGAASRYYEADEDEEIRNNTECAVCGESGHDRKSCPHEQCLACGALDEHSTRDCPMSVSCFRCGGMGHITRNCHMPPPPIRGGARDCGRCGSTRHADLSCPSLWRIYSYNTEEEYARGRAVAASEMEKERRREGGDFSDRSSDEERSSGNLIAPRPDWDPAEIWCYNCADRGDHWGDDCPRPRSSFKSRGSENSLYSEYVSALGPFGGRIPSRFTSERQRRDQASNFGFGGNHQHFDFSVGPSASMHVSGRGMDDYGMRTVDDLFDPSKMPKSQREKAKDREREARERQRKDSDSRRESDRSKRRRSPSPDSRGRASSSKSKREGRGKDQSGDSDDDWFSNRAASSSKKGKELNKKDIKREANRKHPSPEVPLDHDQARRIREDLKKEITSLRKPTSSSNVPDPVGINLQQKLSRYDQKLTARGIDFGKSQKRKEDDRDRNEKSDKSRNLDRKKKKEQVKEDRLFDSSSKAPSLSHRISGSGSKAARYDLMKEEKEERLRLENRGGPSDSRHGGPRQRYGEPSFGQFSTDPRDDDRNGSGYYEDRNGADRDGGRSGSGSHKRKKGGGWNGNGNGGSNRPKYQGSY